MGEAPVSMVWRQPVKFFVSWILSIVLGVVVISIAIVLDLGIFEFAGFVFLAYIVPWQVAFHMFELWPATVFSKRRGVQGATNAVIFWIILVLIALAYKYIYPAQDLVTGFAFIETSIFIFAVWYFWFEGASGLAGRQPRHGFIAWAFIWGAGAMLVYNPWIPVDINWMWFPVALSQILAFGWWPIQDMKQPLKGIVGVGIAGVFTWTLFVIYDRLDMNMFTTAKGPLFNIILTAWVLMLTVGANNAPFRRLKQPLKGLAITFLAIVAAIITYVAQVAVIPDTFTDQFTWFIYWATVVMMMYVVLFTIGTWFYGYTWENLMGEPEETA